MHVEQGAPEARTAWLVRRGSGPRVGDERGPTREFGGVQHRELDVGGQVLLGDLDPVIQEAVKLTLAAGVNQRVKSADLGEHVIYNPNVWSAHHISIAAFLQGLPPAERDSLLGLCQQAADSPGLVVSSYGSFQPAMLSSARKVGLVQAATVKSSVASGEQTYVFSPLMETEDDKLQTTEVLHQRKLFVSHILYGHEKAVAGRGRIYDPRVLVRALLPTAASDQRPTLPRTTTSWKLAASSRSGPRRTDPVALTSSW